MTQWSWRAVMNLSSGGGLHSLISKWKQRELVVTSRWSSPLQPEITSRFWPLNKKQNLCISTLRLTSHDFWFQRAISKIILSQQILCLSKATIRVCLWITNFRKKNTFKTSPWMTDIGTIRRVKGAWSTPRSRVMETSRLLNTIPSIPVFKGMHSNITYLSSQTPLKT